MKDLKHNKLKNPALIFDILANMLVQESGGKITPPSIKILKKYYTEGTTISKVYNLYKILSESVDVSSPDKLIDAVCEAYGKVDTKTYNRELYNLNGDINKYYGKDKFYAMRIPRFKIHASIYKLLENERTDNPLQYVQCRDVIIEALTTDLNGQDATDTQKMWNSIDPPMRKVVLNMMVEKFNERYSTALNKKQKQLLKMFISKNPKSQQFVDYICEEAGSLSKKIMTAIPKVKDDVLKIKLKEVSNVLGTILTAKVITTEQVSGILKCYSLVEEIGA